ncbi:DEKNAAE104512 [Brettanomyces naardenensis]|uniref:DEKNAAE104512 n=1 Tax=Brettanomyces naardenensis TaxID=13370 RepID=A0A448YRL6_BRENA|nr:DEKNAAE104512 [Brettanomyces naardenensis]
MHTLNSTVGPPVAPADEKPEVLNQTPVPKPVRHRRRKYSKTGCKECKRRKIKCDEAKPVCWHCRRLEKVCEYAPPKPRKRLTRPVGSPLDVPVQASGQAPLQHASSATISSMPAQGHHHSLATPQSAFSGGPPRVPPGNYSAASFPSQIPPALPIGPPAYKNLYRGAAFAGNSPSYRPLPPPPRTFSATPAGGSPSYYGSNVPMVFPGISSLPPAYRTSSSPFPAFYGSPGDIQASAMGMTPVTNGQVATPDDSAPGTTPGKSISGTNNQQAESQQPAPPAVENPSPTSSAHSFNMALATLNIPNFDSSLSANSLAQSLNEILITKIDEVKPNIDYPGVLSPLMEMLEQGDYYKVAAGNTEPTAFDLPTHSQQDLPDFVTKPVSIDSFQFSGDHKIYLEYFCNDFARVISPLTPSPTLNPARDILLMYAKDNNYLLAAVLSCGALQLHRRSHEPKDEAAYCNYLSTSIQLLSSILSDEQKIKENIEPMILTILLLTSYTAMSNIQKWRPHLKAAKELLATYVPDEAAPANSAYVIAFCRAWYSSIEVLAGLTAPQGGTAGTEDEIDSLVFDIPNLKYYLERMRISRKDDFNNFYGCTNALGMALQRLTKYMRRFRAHREKKQKNQAVKPYIKTSEFHGLMKEIYNSQDFFIISKDGIVPHDHFMHPDNNLQPPSDFEPLSSEAVEKMVLENGQEVCISWYDISHHSLVWTGVLIMLSMIAQLPKRHDMVQEAVHEVLKLMIFLHAKEQVTGYVLMLLQISMYIAGLNCIEEEDRRLVLKFFDNLNVMGNISATVSTEKLKRKWKRYDETRRNLPVDAEFDDFDEEELPGDIIAY